MVIRSNRAVQAARAIAAFSLRVRTKQKPAMGGKKGEREKRLQRGKP